VRLVIAGTGPEEAALRALAAELGVADRVRFAGRLERDAMAALLRESDVAINPSRVDNMPNSVLEALASGLPVVSTRVGGVPHNVQDGTTALLIPPADPAAIAAAVGRLLDNPDLRVGLASRGLAEVQRYAWPRVASRWSDVYRGVLARNAALRPATV
jgi:glycosyltransferase involved in cell wall biosynthesis